MNKFLDHHIPGLLLLAIVFTPTLPRLAPLRFEDILIGLSVSLICLSPRKKRIKVDRQLRVGRYLTIISFAGILGICVGSLFLDVVPVGRDLMFIPQTIKYFLVFWIIGKTLPEKGAIASLMAYIFICAFGASMVAIAQYWNLFGVNNWLTPMFFTKKLALQQMQAAQMDFRVKGTMGNPNYFGYLLGWLMAWLLSFRFLARQSNRKVKFIILPLVGLIGIAMLLLQSRTNLLGVLAMVFVLFMSIKKPKKRKAIVISILFVGGMLAVFLNSDMLAERGFGQRLKLGGDSTHQSYNARIRDLVQPLIYAVDYPWLIPFGQGPSKGELRSDSHNGFTWMLQRFGLLGMGAYLLLIYRSARYAKRLQGIRWLHDEPRYMALAALLACIVWVLGDLGGNIFKDPRLMSLNMISLACVQVALLKSLCIQSHRPAQINLTVR